MNLKSIKKLRIGLITLGVIIFLFISYQNFTFNGEMQGVYSVNKRSNFISNLTPTSRLLNDNKELIGAMKLEPVYLDLRLTRPFEKLHLELTYKKPARNATPARSDMRSASGEQSVAGGPVDVKLLVGPLVDKTGWRFANKSVDEYSEVLANGFSKAIIDYDIVMIDEEKENIYKLGFSSPGLNAKNLEESIQIKDVKLILSKTPVTMENFWSRFKDYLSRIITN